MGAPRAILFDLGGTLLEETSYDPVRGSAALLARVHNPRGVTLEQMRAVAERIQTEVDPRREASGLEHSATSFHRLLLERLGLSFDLPADEVTLTFWRAAVVMTPQPGVSDALRSLPASMRLGVVSNSTNGEAALRHELAKHGLLERFELVMASAEYGVRKPSPLLFETALGRLGLAAEDVWFVGDSLENDVAGAKAVGMRAVWYDPPRRGAPAPAVARSAGVDPDVRIAHWRELPELVRRASDRSA